MAYNLKSIKKEFAEKGVFYTPPELAEFIKSFIPQDVQEVYDPTCWDWWLLSVFPDDVKKYGQEINDHQLKIAQERVVNFEGVCEDTLKSPAFRGQKFKYIVANPPFSIKRDPKEDARFSDAPCLAPPSKADYAFILHCLYYLKTWGKAVILEFPWILYRGQKEWKIRQWLCEQWWIEKIIEVEGNKFTDTKIATVLLIFDKTKTNRNIWMESEGIGREVSYEEISANGYILTPSHFIQKPEPQKTIIDPRALEQKAREGVLRLIKYHIEYSKTIAKLEKRERKDFCDKIIDTVLEIKGQE